MSIGQGVDYEVDITRLSLHSLETSKGCAQRGDQLSVECQCLIMNEITARSYGAKVPALRSAVYSVTPPGIFSLVELIYRMLSSLSPTHTTSETALPNGAFVVLPVLVSRKYHVEVDLADVQLYFVSENNALSCYYQQLEAHINHTIHTPFAFKVPVLRLGAASIPSVVIACTFPSNRPAANTTDLSAMISFTKRNDNRHENQHDVQQALMYEPDYSDGGTASLSQQSLPRTHNSKKAGAKQSFLRLVQLSIDPGLGRQLVTVGLFVIVMLCSLTCPLEVEDEVGCVLGKG